jgi:hypothetical protein
MTLATAVQIVAVVTGFVSVYYWWRSATLKPVETPTVAGVLPRGGPGDQFFETEGGKTIHMRFSEQSTLNARAAAWTGVTTGLQALALIVGISCAH